ncbi:hypothetical protein D3C86_1877850 [compost metagenome]
MVEINAFTLRKPFAQVPRKNLRNTLRGNFHGVIALTLRFRDKSDHIRCGQTFAVLIKSTLKLVGCRSAAPQKILRKSCVYCSHEYNLFSIIS